MALRNGLLVHGPSHWAAAVRDREGRILVASGRKPRLRATEQVPGLRGVVKLGEAVAIIPLVKRALPQAQLPFQTARVVGATVGVTTAAALIRRRGRGVAGEATIGALSIAPALLALRGGDLAAYHGVEHKAIAAYEQGVEDAADAAKEHDRCGSNLVAPLLASNVAGTVLLHRVLERPGTVANGVVAIGSIAAAVEVFAWSERHAGTRLARALRRPGYELQRAIGTREPTEEQLDVGRAALAEIVRVESAQAAQPAPSR